MPSINFIAFETKIPAVWLNEVDDAVFGNVFMRILGGTMEGSLVLEGNAALPLEAVPLQQLTAAVAAALATNVPALILAADPVGTIKMWATGAAPLNYLECDGAAVSRTTYAALFALWGTTYGAGNGTTTFNLMDLRGYFPRFWDHGRGLDPARTIGSTQVDDLKAHTHTYRGAVIGTGGADPSGTGGTFEEGASGSTGGTETRPINTSVMAIVKAL